MVTFRLGELRISLRFSFLAVLCLLTLVGRQQGLFCAAAGVVHELGHLFFMVLFDALPKELTFSAEGISITPSGRLLQGGKEAVILLGGSFFNLLLGLFPLEAEQCLSSLALGAFNLLPLSGLDGGKLAALLLSPIAPPVGERFCRILSAATAAALSLGAVWLFFTTGNFTLLITVCYFLFLG